MNKMKMNLRAYVELAGDWSVGIPSSIGFVDLGISEYYADEEERKWIRERLKEFFEELHDNGTARIRFSDECPQCGKVMQQSGYCRDCFINEL